MGEIDGVIAIWDIDLAFLGFFALGCDYIVLKLEWCTWREVGGDPVVF